MGSYIESYIDIHIEISERFTDNPIDWLCGIVCPIVAARDDSIDEDLLRDATETKASENGTTKIDLFCENFKPSIGLQEDEVVVFNGMTDKIKDALREIGATGTINIYGYYTDDGPDVSSFVRLEESPQPTAA